MPVYDFICEECGSFEQRRSAAETSGPLACPTCGREARRVFSIPNTRSVPAALSGARERAEKSAHEPAVVRRPAGGSFPGTKYRPDHGGHCHH